MNWSDPVPMEYYSYEDLAPQLTNTQVSIMLMNPDPADASHLSDPATIDFNAYISRNGLASSSPRKTHP